MAKSPRPVFSAVATPLAAWRAVVPGIEMTGYGRSSGDEVDCLPGAWLNGAVELRVLCFMAHGATAAVPEGGRVPHFPCVHPRAML